MNAVTLTAAQLDTLRTMAGRAPGGFSCDMRTMRALERKGCIVHDRDRWVVLPLGHELVRRADARAERREGTESP